MILKTTQEVKDRLISADARFSIFLQKYGDVEIVTENDYFVSLCSSIVGQQLSNKVADVIWKRLVRQVCDTTSDGSYLKNRSLQADIEFKEQADCVTPEKILAADEQVLRACGLSFSKIKYIKALSQAVKDGALSLEMFGEQSDEEIVAELTKIKGIGKWTAEMFLIFSLGRQDVFSFGDMGLYNALCGFLKAEKLTKQEVGEYTDKFAPYRTFLSLYLWKSLDVK